MFVLESEQAKKHEGERTGRQADRQAHIVHYIYIQCVRRKRAYALVDGQSEMCYVVCFLPPNVLLAVVYWVFVYLGAWVCQDYYTYKCSYRV